jgi:hypothetical protein
VYKQASLVQRHLLTLFVGSPSKARWFALVALVGCAHGSSADQFRQLSRHEATLSRAEAERGRLVQADVCSSALHEATSVVCREAEAVCDLSRALKDRDAQVRCLRATDACEAAREHALVRCP